MNNSDAMAAGLTTFVGGLFVLGVLFLLGREIVCWYWKINKLVELQVAQLDEVRRLRVDLNAYVNRLLPPPQS